MKQIDEISVPTPNKLFQTPQKKQRYPKKYSDCKGNQAYCAEFEERQRFDLSQSPRFIGSTSINIHQRSFLKQSGSQNDKKSYSPILLKLEESMMSTPIKFRQMKESRDLMQTTYGDLQEEQNFEKCYDDIISRIMNGQENIEIPLPQIFQPQFDNSVIYSQLLTFTLNPKNSRKLVYNQDKMTVTPIFECLGCDNPFDNPSALGGHLSRCQMKHQHYRRLKEYYQTCEFISEESDPNDQEIEDISILENTMKTPDKKNTRKKENQRERKRQKQRQKQKQRQRQRQKQRYRQSPCFFFSSESKSVSKSIIGEEKNYFDHFIHSQKFDEKEEQSPKIEKTLKKISKKAFIPNKSRGQNKRIFKMGQ